MRPGWQLKEEGAVFVIAYVLVALILRFAVNPEPGRLLGVSLAIALALTAVEVLADMRKK